MGSFRRVADDEDEACLCVAGRGGVQPLRVVITKHGRPAAAVLSVEDLASLEETLEVLSSAALIDDVRAGVAEVVTGDVVVLTKAQALELIREP